MEKCPGCGRFTLDDSGSEYKRCFTTGCSYRVYPDRSLSFIKHDWDKIRRVRRYLNGTEENVKEFEYPQINSENGAVSKRLRPGHPPFGRKVRLTKNHQVINPPIFIPMSDEIIISDTGVIKILGTRQSPDYPIVPAGAIGIVGEGLYFATLFNYNFECPVQFIDPQIPKTIGVPWNMLEFAD